MLALHGWLLFGVKVTLCDLVLAIHSSLSDQVWINLDPLGSTPGMCRREKSGNVSCYLKFPDQRL